MKNLVFKLYSATFQGDDAIKFVVFGQVDLESSHDLVYKYEKSSNVSPPTEENPGLIERAKMLFFEKK